MEMQQVYTITNLIIKLNTMSKIIKMKVEENILGEDHEDQFLNINNLFFFSYLKGVINDQFQTRMNV